MSAPGPIRSAAGTKDNWATPQYIFDHWNERFHFDLDAAADASNAKCADYLDEEYNSLIRSWGTNRRVWLNPPYGNLIGWIDACIRESQQGNIIVALLPNNTDSYWFHEAFRTANEITFLQGRINFIDPATGKAGKGNTGGSIFVTWLPPLFWDDGYPRSPSVRSLHIPRPKEAK